MTQITHESSGLDIYFPGWEAAMAGRNHLHVPAQTILFMRAEAGWTSEVLGMRSGLVVSGYRKLGTFTHPSGVRRLVSMKRGMPLLRLQTNRNEIGFDEILLSARDADRIARDIHAGLSR